MNFRALVTPFFTRTILQLYKIFRLRFIWRNPQPPIKKTYAWKLVNMHYKRR
jgi:hypothetical protein